MLARYGRREHGKFEQNFGGRVSKGKDVEPGDLPFIVAVCIFPFTRL